MNNIPSVRFGMIADPHYADRDDDCPEEMRFYRASLTKMNEAIAFFDRQRLDFVVELGDLKDYSQVNGQKDKASPLARLEMIEQRFRAFNGPVYHVCGNHDFDIITPAEFFHELPMTATPSPAVIIRSAKTE